MKQTNNAIKFLMAQYRAIFRNANLKMFLAAATAAAAMAAGSAQAATTVATWKDLASGEYNNQATADTDKKIAIEGDDATGANNVNTTGFDVIITSGDATIKGKTGAQEFTVKQPTSGEPVTSSITLRGNDATTLTIGGSQAGENATVTIDTFVAEQGKLTLTGSGADATTVLNASEITIGGDAAKKGAISVGAFSSLGGSGTSSIKILSGGELTFKDDTSEATASQGVLLSGGKIDLGVGAASSGTIVKGLKAESGVLTLGDTTTAGQLTVKSGDVEFTGAESFNSAHKDSKLIVSGGNVTFGAGSIKDNKGTVELQGIAANSSKTLSVQQADWSKLLGGKIAVTGTDATSVLNVNVEGTASDKALDLADVVDATAGTFAALNSNAPKVTATNATVAFNADYAQFTAGAKLAEASGSFNFGTLTVGKDGAFAIEAGEVAVQNALKVTAAADTQTLTVSATGVLTLDAKDPTGKAEGSVDAKTVTVNATNASDEALSFKNGTWSTTGALTVTKGTVNVSNATLNLGGKLTTTYGTSAADGRVVADASIIDATSGDFALGASGTVLLGNTSTLVLNADKVFTIGQTDSKLTVATEFSKQAVVANSNSKISLKPTSGTDISLTKEQYDALLSGTGFNGLFVGLNVDIGEVKPEMAIGGADGIMAGIGDKYDNTVGTTSGTIANGTYDMGAVEVTSGTELTLGDLGSLTLSNAGINGGNFVSGKDAEGKEVTGSVVLGDKTNGTGNGLTLGGSGKIGEITTAADGMGSVTFGEAKTETTDANIGNVTVEGSIGGVDKSLDAVVVNGSDVTVQSGDVYAQNLNLNGGSLSLDKDKTLTIGNGNNSAAPNDLASTIDGDLTAGALTVETDTAGTLSIAGDAEVTLGSFKGTSGTDVTVGNAVDGTAAVYAGEFDLDGGSLLIDPAYGKKHASVVVGSFKANAVQDSAGIVNGKIVVGQNAALGVGFDEADTAEFDTIIAGYLDAAGSFTDAADIAKGQLSNALVINKGITLTANDGIIVDKTITTESAPPTVSGNELKLAAGSGLLVTDNVYKVDPTTGEKTGAAITFNGSAGKVNAVDSTVVLVGDFSAKDNDLTLFSGIAADPTGLTVKSANGLLSGTFSATNKGHLDLNIVEAMKSKVFLDASAPVKQLLLDKAEGNLAQGSGLGWDFIGQFASSSTSGAVVDAAAHAATYAGAQQAAVAAVGSMADAVGGRVGSMGVEAATISATGSQANGGVWLAPMYKSVDADGFNAEGASYGADVDLAGVAFGTDTVNGNMRFGAVFNIGSGDADGKGNGNGLKDEFDYYGFGMYSVMGFGNFALVGDASLNVISHEVEGLGLKGSADTTAVTMGVTGQYTIANPMVDVTPHLGARFIRLDTDSYDLKSAEGTLATTDFDVQNVFSIPLGVTLSKAFEMGGWSLAPSADLSITFNTGDTDAKSTTQFTGVKAIDLTTEVLDEVTYGVAVGLGAQYGAFGTQIGINYTGSENTDSFGVNANARYMF